MYYAEQVCPAADGLPDNHSLSLRHDVSRQGAPLVGQLHSPLKGILTGGYRLTVFGLVHSLHVSE